MDRSRELEGNILERIRQCPAMYLGCAALSALHQFLAGYELACFEHGIAPPATLPEDFHDWVAYRLHFQESTSGFRNMILSRVSDEQLALQRFFELLDEHRARQARLVARIRCHPADFKVQRQTYDGKGTKISDEEVACAPEVAIVVYTDDPGLFLINDSPTFEEPRRSQFRPSLSWIRAQYRPDLEFTTIVDQGQFERLLCEQVVFERLLAEEREVSKAKPAGQQSAIN